MSGPKRATLLDVASAASVSRTTASDALRGQGRVEARTQARVLAAAARLGYRPNPHARVLRSGGTAILALLVPVIGTNAAGAETIGLEYYMHLTSAVTACAFSHGHAVVLVPPVPALRDLRELPVDGAIVADPVSGDPRVQMLDSLRVPVVTIERDYARDDPWYVASDHGTNTRKVLDHLAEVGARRTALIVPDVTWSWQTETVAAFGVWMRENRASGVVRSVPVQGPENGAYAATVDLLSDPSPPDAIFALAEGFSSGVLRAAGERSVRIPEDLLVVVGIDTHQCRTGDPSLTALDLVPQEQAKAAVAMLTTRLEGGHVGAPTFITTPLHVRDSTRKAAQVNRADLPRAR